MADVTFRAASSWATSHNSWPATTAAGDLAVMVVIGEPGTFTGWVRHALDRAGWFDYATVLRSPRIAVYSRIVPDDLSGAPGTIMQTTTPTVGRITTWDNASGIGFVRSGPVPVRARGAAFYAATIDNSTSTPSGSGFTVLSNAGEGGPYPGFASWTRAWCRIAYKTTSTAGTFPLTWLGRLLGIEILPQEAPYDPTLYTPAPGSDVAYNADTTFEWQHNPAVTDGYQDAVRIRYRQVGTGTWYWVGSDGSEQASETTIVQAAQTIDLDGGTLTQSVEYEWQVATREATDQLWSDYSASSTFTAVSPPSVTVTDPTTVTDDLTPTIEWTPTTPQGSQTAFRVTISETGYDSGVVRGSDTSWTVPVQDWTSGSSYTAGVVVQQTGGSWSPEGTRSFTLSWTAPSAPTCSAANSATGGIDVTVSGVASGRVAEVQRTFDGGVNWEDVTQSPVESDGSDIVVKDVTVRYNVEVIYRARASTELDGRLLYSSWDVATAVTCTDTGAYIVDSRDWSNYVAVTLRDSTGASRVRSSAVVYGLGDSRPMVDHAPYAGQVGTWTVQVSTVAQLEALATLLGVEDDVSAPPWPFLLRWPPRTNGEADKTLEVAITGSVGWASVGYAGSPYRDVTLTWVEQ